MYSDLTIKVTRYKRPTSYKKTAILARERTARRLDAGKCALCDRQRINPAERYCETHKKKIKWWLYKKVPKRSEENEEPAEIVEMSDYEKEERKYLIDLYKNEHH